MFCEKVVHGSKVLMNANHLFTATNDDVYNCLGSTAAVDKLSHVQASWLEKYRATCGVKDIYDLSQNPDTRPRCSLVDGSAPCFTTNSGRLWLPAGSKYLVGLSALDWATSASLSLRNVDVTHRGLEQPIRALVSHV